MSTSERAGLEIQDSGIFPQAQSPSPDDPPVSTSTEETFRERIEALRAKALHEREKTGLIPLIRAMKKKYEGIIIEGRDFFENHKPIRMEATDGEIGTVIPFSEESVILALLWRHDDCMDEYGDYFARAIFLEVFPEGGVIVYGSRLGGTSISTQEEISANPKKGIDMFKKAYRAPNQITYSPNDGKPRLTNHSLEMGALG